MAKGGDGRAFTINTKVHKRDERGREAITINTEVHKRDERGREGGYNKYRDT